MPDHESALQILDDAVSAAIGLGIGHRIAEDDRLDGTHIRLDGRPLRNFASCSYLGLEMHPRLRQGVHDAVDRFGTQFSSSRAYISAPPYAELETLLATLFDAHVIATPSTSLGHLAAIPTLISSEDAVILDHQAHHSVQIAVRQVAALGARVEIVRHNHMGHLEKRIRRLARDARHVWYMADGVYSMYGDFAPFSELEALLERHDQLHLYLDDAHGMSWAGKNGRGVALSHMTLHPKMVMATSMNKSFAAAGGVLVFPDLEVRRRVRNCGGPLLFSGPIQPPMLGAALASARLHLSSEISELQERLASRIAFCDDLLADSGLPVLSAPGSPIKFVGAGVTAAAQSLVALLMKDGFYSSVAQFPAVSLKRSGARFTVTLHNSEQDIEGIVDSLKRHFAPVVARSGASREDVFRAFGLSAGERVPKPAPRCGDALRLEVSHSIADIPAEDWDRALADRGAFESRALASLERCFHADQDAANAWRFLYYRVVDDRGRARLATFFTEVPWKADMLASEAVSRAVEERRLEEPDYLVLRALTMGSLLTEGDPLYLPKAPGVPRRELMSLLIDAVEAEAESRGVDLIAFRDLPVDDSELDRLLQERDFLKVDGPERMLVDIDWEDEEGFLRGLSRNARRHQRRSVRPWNDHYEVEILRCGDRDLSEEELGHLYGLYLQVKRRNLEMNTFPLPEDLLTGLLAAPGWELALFRLKADPALPVGFVATFVGETQTVPTFLGLDYRWVRDHGLYRQCLRHTLLRARELGRRRVHLGFGARFEKERFGARPEPSALYMQMRDQYPLDVLAQLAEGAAR
jgi:7-keto-8-aminopelargonate synthetase-like enzyme